MAQPLSDPSVYAVGATPVHSQATAATASSTLLAANVARRSAILQNTHASATARVTLDGTTPTATVGLQIGPGQTLTLGPSEPGNGCVTGIIKGIREGSVDVTFEIVEFT